MSNWMEKVSTYMDGMWLSSLSSIKLQSPAAHQPSGHRFGKRLLCGDRFSSPGLTSGPGCTAYKEVYGERTRVQSTIFDIRDCFKSLSIAQRSLLSQVSRAVQLVLVMPATNATSERSFSALRRVKSYLRSMMGQQRLNNLMVLHVHKDRTHSLNLMDTANDFVRDSENRLHEFGKFQ